MPRCLLLKTLTQGGLLGKKLVAVKADAKTDRAEGAKAGLEF